MLNWFRKKEEPAAGGEAAPKKGLFARLRDRLAKTQRALVDSLKALVGRRIDDDLLEEIEEIMIQSDIGVKASGRIVDYIRKEGRNHEEVNWSLLTGMVRKVIMEILASNNRELVTTTQKPFVILIVGVNGTGKTTTVGKLALEMVNEGKKVLIVAGDTFRAAAVEQLAVWAERSGAGLVRQREGADPAAVCFEALDATRKDPPDVILIDTAGRLHTKTYLMDELSKVIRVIKKVYPDAPHETVCVLDATTGQNALAQVKTFREVANVTGLIMTKLDGTAKGGVLVAVKEAHDLPIYRIGIGESPEDLRDFDPEQFASALLGMEIEVAPGAEEFNAAGAGGPRGGGGA